MGCAGSQLLSKHNINFDDVIKENSEPKKSLAKLLILGNGDAGKSTFMKQMKLLYKNGFS